MASLPFHQFLAKLACTAPEDGHGNFKIVADNAAGHRRKDSENEEEENMPTVPNLTRASSMDGSCRWDTGTSCLRAPKLLAEPSEEDIEELQHRALRARPKTGATTRACSIGSILDLPMSGSVGSRWESSSSSSFAASFSSTSSKAKTDGAAKLPRRKNQQAPSTAPLMKTANDRGDLKKLLNVLEEVDNELCVFSSSASYSQLDIPSELFRVH